MKSGTSRTGRAIVVAIVMAMVAGLAGTSALAADLDDATLVPGQALTVEFDGGRAVFAPRADQDTPVVVTADTVELDRVSASATAADGAVQRQVGALAVTLRATTADGTAVTAFPHTVEVEDADGTGRPAVVSQLTPGVTVRFTATADDVAGLDPATVGVYARTTSDREWERLPSAYDPATGAVVGHADQLGQFAVMGEPAIAAQPGPTVVLDPDDDLGFAEWPDITVTELPLNLAAVADVKSALERTCNANVVVTRGSEPFVDRTLRAAVAAAADPDLMVTLAFNALTGSPFGVETDGGVRAWASDPADVAFAERFVTVIPAFTGRPATQGVSPPEGFLPYAPLDAIPGPYAHVELLFMDHNFDFPVITDGFDLIVDAAVSAMTDQLVAQGFDCSGSPLPERPSEPSLARLRDLGFQNYQIYGADPVSFSSGNFVIDEPIFTLPGLGDQAIELGLTYNSQDDRDGVFGAGWTFAYNSAAQRYDDGSFLIRLDDGRSFVFESRLGGWIDPPGANATLSRVTDGVVELTLNDFERYRFAVEPANGYGVLAQRQDRQGNRLMLDWGPASAVGIRPLRSIVDEAGQRVEVRSDGDGRVVGLVHPDGRTWNLGYDAGRLSTLTDPRGVARRFTYTAGGLLDGIVAGDGVRYLSNEYDGDGRVIAQTNGEGDRRRFDYTADDRTVYTDALGNQTTYVFNDLGQVVETIDALDRSASTTYDDDYNPVAETDANGNTTRTEFDGDGRPVKRTDPLGNTIEFTYNSFGDLIRFEEPDGSGGVRATTFEVNDQGRVTRTTFADGSTTTAVYDDHGDRISQTDQNGNTTTFTYDERGNNTEVIDPLGGSTKRTYSLSNQVLTSTDENGYTTTFYYDRADNRTRIVDALGNTTSFTYDENNLLTAETDALGRTTSYTHDGNLNLTGITFPDGTTKSFELDGEYGVVATIDQRGHRTEVEYDALLRPVATVDEAGKRWTVQYDPVGNPIELTDPDGHKVQLAYDELDRVVGTTDPFGQLSTTAYDAAGNRIADQAPDGTTVTMRYDRLGRRIAVTDQQGFTSTETYDRAGNVIAVTDRRGNVTSMVYDANNRVVRTEHPDGGVSTQTYDPAGNPTALTDPEGGTLRTGYDALNRAVTNTDQLGARSTTEYDPVGNPVATVDADGHRWGLEYDRMDRVVAEVTPMGDREVTRYDELGNVVARVAADGVVTELVYDERNDLVRVVENAKAGEPAGSDVNVTTRYERNASGWVIAEVDPNGHRTEFDVDALGRVVTMTDPLGRVSSTSYNARGDLATETDANGNTTTYGYFPDRLVRSITYEDGSEVTYDYDADNFRTSMTDPLGTSTWTRDWRGRELVSVDANGNSIARTYDLNGNVTSIVYPDGFDSRRTYDAANRLVTLGDPSGVITYERDALGRATSISQPNGIDTRFRFDAEGKPVSIDHLRVEEGKRGNHGRRGSVLRFEYAYTVDDLLTERRILSDQKRLEVTDYRYDGLDRLTGSRTVEFSNARRQDKPKASSTAHYRYDSASNRVLYRTSDDPATSKPSDPLAVTYTYDSADQLTVEHRETSKRLFEITRRYDANGNLVEEQTAEFDRKGKEKGKPEVERFRYNLEDELIADRSSTWERDGIGRAIVRHDGKDVIELVHDDVWLVAQLGKRGELYVRDDDQALRSQSGWKRPKKPEDEDRIDYTTESLLYDHLGTIYAAADRKGKAKKRVSYLDYGSLDRQSKPASAFGFAGELHDRESGRIHFYARSYDPATGRFLQQDRIEGDRTVPMTRHQYLYALANPANNADLLGYFGCCGIDVDIPNPIDAVKSVGGKVVDATVSAGEWAWEHKEAIAVSVVVGVAVGACIAATAGICGGFVVGAGLGGTLLTGAAVGASSAVAFGVTDRALDDDPSTTALDPAAIAFDAVVGGGFGTLTAGAGLLIPRAAGAIASSSVGQTVARSPVTQAARSTTAAVSTPARQAATATASTAQRAATRITTSAPAQAARNVIGRVAGRQPASTTGPSAASTASTQPTLFRGTSEGFAGSPGLQRVGVTPATTDPAVATAFATNSDEFGQGVVHIARAADLPGVKRLPPSLGSLEAEVPVGMLPADFASAASTSIPSAQARLILTEMGLSVPSRLPNAAALNHWLHSRTPMTASHIAEFVRRAGGS